METVDLTKLPIRQKIGQLFFIGLPGPTIDNEAESLIREICPGGVCLFARNIREAHQTRKLLDDVDSISEVPPFLSLDQEGGLVDRLRRVVTPMPAAGKFRDVTDASEFGRIVAETIRLLGFNMDFAPVVDVIDKTRSGYSNGLHSRAFGSSVEDTIELAGEFLAELQNGGAIGCIKHFPGLGASKVDSHEELPVVNISEEELESIDLAPYRHFLSGSDVQAVMVAHAAYPELRLQRTGPHGKLLPSSLSGDFIDGLLRRDLGFERVVITDDLEMGAVVKNFGIGDACKLAIGAGADMLAICAGAGAIREGYDAIHKAVLSGEIFEDRIDTSLRRIAAVKQMLKDPLPFDRRRLEELSASIADLNNRLN